ncbi:membrane protein [Streptomyces noursei ATCC 11455]|nr:membrane protein [Streptomyces noursei ATCC 11455]ANZ21878.1 membrane protein [Streptomyces noursei ATCC 11455]
MLLNDAQFPRLRRAFRHPLQVLDREGIPPWQAVGALLVVGAVAAWLIDVYLSIRR